MRGVSVFVILSVVCWAQTPSQTRVAEPPYIWDVIEKTVGRKRPLLSSFPRSGFSMTPREIKQQHSPENCQFPLDVVILQDATESFDDNIDSMRKTQLDLIFSGITQKHPQSRFAVVSFKDKPITPLGNRDDYCTRFDTNLTPNITEVKEAYRNIVAYGGYDAPENQFGTLFNVLTSPTVGWSSDPAAAKLVVVSTDAGPHFEGDSTTGTLPAFDPAQAKDEIMEECVAHYYPSADVMKNLLLEKRAYLASLIYDGDWADNWPSNSWKAFNRFIGQSDHFVAAQAPDSSDFWAKLTVMINAIEDIECGHQPSHPPTNPPPAGPSTTNHPGPHPSEPAPCQCPCATCDCCPQVIIRLQHRPNTLHLDVDN